MRASRSPKFFVALILSLVMAVPGFCKDLSVLRKQHYEEIHDERLFKIVKAMIAEKKLNEADTALTVLEKRPRWYFRLEAAKIRSRRLDSLRNIKRAIRILSSLLKSRSNLKGLAAFELARIYRDVDNLNKRDQVLGLFSQSAELGNYRAYIEIANTYFHGIGVKPNVLKAYEFYELAAKYQSSAPVIYFARNLQRNTDIERCGLKPKDIVKKYLPQLTAESTRGLPASAKELARLYLEGNLIPRNIDKARTWLRAAIMNGDIGAMRDLALLELKIDRSSEFASRSIRLLENAAAAGNKGALKALKKLEDDELIKTFKDRQGKASWTVIPMGEKSAELDLPSGILSVSESFEDHKKNFAMLQLDSESTPFLGPPKITAEEHKPGQIGWTDIDPIITGSTQISKKNGDCAQP